MLVILLLDQFHLVIDLDLALFVRGGHALGLLLHLIDLCLHVTVVVGQLGQFTLPSTVFRSRSSEWPVVLSST